MGFGSSWRVFSRCGALLLSFHFTTRAAPARSTSVCKTAWCSETAQVPLDRSAFDMRQNNRSIIPVNSCRIRRGCVCVHFAAGLARDSTTRKLAAEQWRTFCTPRATFVAPWFTTGARNSDRARPVTFGSCCGARGIAQSGQPWCRHAC